jgi:hypothetical protein
MDMILSLCIHFMLSVYVYIHIYIYIYIHTRNQRSAMPMKSSKYPNNNLIYN